ncbi:hypothetical protein [Methylobacter sp.]
MTGNSSRLGLTCQSSRLGLTCQSSRLGLSNEQIGGLMLTAIGLVALCCHVPYAEWVVLTSLAIVV